MPARLLSSLLGVCLATPVFALKPMADQQLALVTGQAQGLRLTSEYDARIDSISYIDDDGVGANGSVGSLSLSPVRLFTPTNRPIEIDIEVKQVNGKKAVVFTNRDLPVELRVGSLAINGDSLGGVGQGNFAIANGDALVTRMYAGGDVGSGFTLDVLIPASMSFDAYYEDDGARLTNTLSFSDPRDANGGGLQLSDMTFDLEQDGLRIGVPQVSNGNFNIYNARLGDDVLNSLAFRNISIPDGGYWLIKNAEAANDIGIELDSRLPQGTALQLVYIAGAVGDNYPNAETHEFSADVALLSHLDVNGLRVNVDGERGLVLDFDRNTTTDGISGNLRMSNMVLQRSDRVGASSPVGLGTLDAQIHLSQNSFLQIEGH
ncbi:hypothetical protein CHH28_10955 [Bacterioplanes sanyensis]|uniref:DUF6160 domain-containing protein n=1 Tax=Bacterioplanes sanyensis TaxID=1249553 RepID=A0A222FKW5_9GAMM|nr:DUF6160 family protein [Bacterioplanes sanyensis]ASP39164.1 hypothetical protein CHH28_10955 [Bacterioplanes sanyensis]